MFPHFKIGETVFTAEFIDSGETAKAVTIHRAKIEAIKIRMVEDGGHVEYELANGRQVSEQQILTAEDILLHLPDWIKEGKEPKTTKVSTLIKREA